MKIYLAGRFSAQEQLREYRKVLEEKNHRVTSRWLDAERPESMDPEENLEEMEAFFRTWCSKDLEDIMLCHLMIIFADDVGSRGGMHGELGYAIRASRRIIVVGTKRPYPNFLYYHHNIEYADTFRDALALL